MEDSTKVSLSITNRTRFQCLGDYDVGLFYGGDGTQLGIQILGALVIAAWTCAINFVLFSALKYYELLRVPDDELELGLDVSMHDGARHPALELPQLGPAPESREANNE